MKSFGPNDHMLAAEIMTATGAKVIGIGGLHVARKARARHSASISLIVHTDYQAKGIGRKILEKLLELADKWLLLKRVELEVSTDNIFAIHLYESFGFVTEGHKKYTYTKDGEFGDTLVMARYRNI
jgi:putative acetyltransferase